MCDDDYFGPLCETTHICASSPCNNGATCVPSGDNSLFVCRCTEEYLGERCDVFNSCYQVIQCPYVYVCQGQSREIDWRDGVFSTTLCVQMFSPSLWPYKCSLTVWNPLESTFSAVKKNSAENLGLKFKNYQFLHKNTFWSTPVLSIYSKYNIFNLTPGFDWSYLWI